MVKSDKCSTTNTLTDYWSPLAVSTTLFFSRCMFKRKKYLAPTLANKKN
jgi:hypothetical protein